MSESDHVRIEVISESDNVRAPKKMKSQKKWNLKKKKKMKSQKNKIKSQKNWNLNKMKSPKKKKKKKKSKNFKTQSMPVSDNVRI